MPKLTEYDRYIKKLCEALGHQDRHGGFTDYSRGLMLPIERKSVEPLAAHTDPLHVSAKHQSLHHLVAKSDWSDRAVLACVRDWVTPDGRARVQVFAKGDSNNKDTLQTFATAVRAVAPGAIGAPVTTLESGRTIVNAFIEAGLLSLVAMILLLAFALRNLHDVVVTLGPLLAASVLTFATCVVIGLPRDGMRRKPSQGVALAGFILIPITVGILSVMANGRSR